jgi:hypothetical protein
VADHESTGIVLWAGESEVPVTRQAFLVDEAGRSVPAPGIGDRVRARCIPAPNGEALAVRIAVLRRGRLEVEARQI